MNSSISNNLKKHNLRTTQCRVEVLDYFYNSNTALSQADLDKKFKDIFDRVTLYRTIKTFLKKGLIHQILDPQEISRYALCSSNCDEKKHNHDHVHFKCNNCGQTKCISTIEVPEIILPKGYSSQTVNLLIQGKCPKC